MLSEEAKKAIGTILRWFVATASKTGKLNVSANVFRCILNDKYGMFADVSDNPQVAANCPDTITRKGCRIWWRGDFLNSVLFDKITAELASRNMKITNVLKISLEEVENFWVTPSSRYILHITHIVRLTIKQISTMKSDYWRWAKPTEKISQLQLKISQ